MSERGWHRVRLRRLSAQVGSSSSRLANYLLVEDARCWQPRINTDNMTFRDIAVVIVAVVCLVQVWTPVVDAEISQQQLEELVEEIASKPDECTDVLRARERS